MILSVNFNILLFVGVAFGKIYFEERFDDDSWTERWVASRHNGTKFGKLERSTGAYSGTTNNSGLRTMENNKYYALSTRFRPVNTANTTLVLQLSVKYEQDLVCEEGFIKLYDCNFDPLDLHEGTPYILLFGPWTCELVGLRTNFFGSQQTNGIIKRQMDAYTHVYTLILEPNLSYQILMDGKIVSRNKINQSKRNVKDYDVSHYDISAYPHICGIGFEIYQKKNGTIFDNILLSDDITLSMNKIIETLNEMHAAKTSTKETQDEPQGKWFGTPFLVDIVPEDLTGIFDCERNIDLKIKNITVNFLEFFHRFLVSIDWSSNNTVIMATAEYNKYRRASLLPIKLWVSFEPREENISDDIGMVLEIVKEANSKFPGTVAAIVINYGFLELNKENLPFVNLEIERVNQKLRSLAVESPELALQISDINCQNVRSIKSLELNLLDYLVVRPMPPEKILTAKNEREILKALSTCLYSRILVNSTIYVYHSHVLIEIDFEEDVYNFDEERMNWVLQTVDRNIVLVSAADKTRWKEMGHADQESLPKNLGSWLYQPAGFNRIHFGAVISCSDIELVGLEIFASTIFKHFQHFIIKTSGHDLGSDGYFKLIDQATNSFRYSKDSKKLQLSILVTIESNEFQVYKGPVDRAISAARKANEISPGTVHTIFFDWLACSRSESCSSYNKNSLEDDACFHFKKLRSFEKITEYGIQTRSKMATNIKVRIGYVLDKRYSDSLLEWMKKGCLKKGGFIQTEALLCKATVRYEDVMQYGGLKTFRIAIEDFSICVGFTKHKSVARPVHFYVNVIGCTGGNSNVTLLLEYAWLMENLNVWAVRENVLLYTNAGLEKFTKCSESARIADNRVCECGWWIQQEPNGTYQDKKTIARQLYERAQGNGKTENDKPNSIVSTEVLLWTLVPSIIVIILIAFSTALLVFHYRSKHILTKREVAEFIKGRQVVRGNTVAGGDEEAETQSYNSERFELSLSTFTIDITSGCLGSGEFARVYRGSIRRDGGVLEAAVKMPNANLVRKSHGYYLALKGLLSKIKTLAYVGEHSHIVSLMGAYTKNMRKGEIAVFLELCQLGSLDKYLHSIKPQTVVEVVSANTEASDSDESFVDEEENEKGKVQVLDQESSDELLRWAGEIASGMEFLASKKLVHADLATRNVLLTGEKVAKISDFGLSRRLYDYTEYVKQNQAPLPWRWMAPESLCRMVFNEKRDIWAFGVTLWEMFTLGDQPYPGLAWNPNISTLLERGLRLAEPKYNVKQIYSIMMQCWNINPKLRPTFSKLKSELNEIN